jgi:hypothetical protein
MEWSPEVIEIAAEWWADNGGESAVIQIIGDMQAGVALGVIATNLGFEGATAAFQPQLGYQERLEYFAAILRALRETGSPREAYVRHRHICAT